LGVEDGLNLDPDIFRGLVLRLETDELSPPEAIFISISEMADDFSCSAAEISLHLEFLTRPRLIEGLGVHGEGAFLFRKLTQEGRLMAKAIQDAEDWKRIKSIYAPKDRSGCCMMVKMLLSYDDFAGADTSDPFRSTPSFGATFACKDKQMMRSWRWVPAGSKRGCADLLVVFNLG
jgi:hypothetical protein